MSKDITIRCDGPGCDAVLADDEGGVYLAEHVTGVMLAGPCRIDLRVTQDETSPDKVEDLCRKCHLKMMHRAWAAFGEHLARLEMEEGVDVSATN